MRPPQLDTAVRWKPSPLTATGLTFLSGQEVHFQERKWWSVAREPAPGAVCVLKLSHLKENFVHIHKANM